MSAWDLYKAERISPTPMDKRHERSTDPLLINGFWRMRQAKTKPDWPILIWTETDPEKNPSGATIFQIGGNVQNTLQHPDQWQDFIERKWPWCDAVSREDYAKALETGRWPDNEAKPARAMNDAERLELPAADADSEVIAEHISALANYLDAVAEPADQENADALAERLERMRNLLKMAETRRIAEKEPHLRAGQAVDEQWRDITAPGKDAGIKAGERLKTYLRKKQELLNAEAAAERKRLAEAAEADRAKINAQAEHMGIAPPEGEVVEPKVEAKRATAGGLHSRASGLKEVKVAVIDDLPMLVNALLFTGTGPDPDAVEYFQGRADKALRGGVTLPGVIVKKELR